MMVEYLIKFLDGEPRKMVKGFEVSKYSLATVRGDMAEP